MTVLMQKRGPGGGQGGGSGGGGRGGGGRGGGTGGFCVCQACGHRESHQQGAPCIEKKCSQCGGVLIRER